MDFAANLRRLRKAAGLTQEALAEKLHLTGQAVSRWETGDGYPEITLLPTLSDLLGVTVDALLRSAALTGEELSRILQETAHLEQAGRQKEAIVLLDTQLALHPEAHTLRDRLAVALLWEGRRLAKEGNAAMAENCFRRAETAAESLLECDDPWLRYRGKAILPELYYRLREKEKLSVFRLFPVDPVLPALWNCAAGTDLLYVNERSFLDTVFNMNSMLLSMAYIAPEQHSENESEKLLIYEPHEGEDEWTVSDGDRCEIEAFRVELMERISGGVGFGPIREFELQGLQRMMSLGAKMGDLDRTLSALELFCDRFARWELVDWEKKRVLALDSYRLALEGLMRKGIERAKAEAEAVDRLALWEKELMTEPVSPLPMLKHIQLFRVFWRDPPLLPFKLQETEQMLRAACFDFVREEPRFRAALEKLDVLVKELEETGELPVKNMEARRRLPQ